MQEFQNINFRKIVENLDLAILVLGGDLLDGPHVTYANQAFAQWAGADAGELVGNRLAFLFPPEDRIHLQEMIRVAVETGRDQVASLKFNGLDKQHRRIDFVIRPLPRKIGPPETCLLTERTSTDAASYATAGDNAADLWKAQQNDPETGVFNRRYLYEQIERECLRLQRYGSAYTLMCIELVSTSEGDDRELGLLDAVFSLMAGVLRDEFRAQDVIGRNQPDQFIVLLPETKLPHALDLAERIRHHVSGMDRQALVGYDLAIGITEGKALDLHFSDSLNRLEQAMERARVTRGVSYFM